MSGRKQHSWWQSQGLNPGLTDTGVIAKLQMVRWPPQDSLQTAWGNRPGEGPSLNLPWIRPRTCHLLSKGVKDQLSHHALSSQLLNSSRSDPFPHPERAASPGPQPHLHLDTGDLSVTSFGNPLGLSAQSRLLVHQPSHNQILPPPCDPQGLAQPSTLPGTSLPPTFSSSQSSLCRGLLTASPRSLACSTSGPLSVLCLGPVYPFLPPLYLVISSSALSSQYVS